ncbi:MAG: F0F1 ATP synthase subunit delta [Candidatus Paceibacterota bacterium]
MATVSIKNLATAIYESSCGKEGKELDVLMTDCAKLIADKHLLGKSEQLLSALEKIIDKEYGVTRATITSKIKLSTKIKEEVEEFIKKRYKTKEVILELKEDPNALGGIKIEIGDEVIDTTLRARLNQLQNYLITN